MNQRKTFVFNNCVGRDHADAFNRSDAFFDLNTYGRQENQATELKVGERCVVAQAATPSDEIQFDTFLVKSIQFLPDKYTGDTCRVFCGKLQRSETLPRIDACTHPIYGVIFNKKTHFKQTSVVGVET